MGSASRQALTAAKTTLTGSLDKSAGADLLAASAQIGGAPALQAALADASADRLAKAQLVARLFGGASESARTILTAVVSENWSSPSELVAGIEELGLRAEAITHSDLADELLAAANVIDSNHELELTLGDKLGDSAAKASLVGRLFTGKLSATAVNVLVHLVANPRGRGLSSALRAGARIVADQGGSELATVTVASSMSAPQQEKLTALLEQSAGRPVRVTTIVDPNVLGGVRIQLGDDVIDGSVRTRLEDLRQRLAG